MQTVLHRQAKKAIDTLPDEKLMVVIDFISYLKSKDRIPNELTLETFSKTDDGRELVKCKNADDMFRKLRL